VGGGGRAGTGLLFSQGLISALPGAGDGAANQGQKYEALNISGLWNLPVIFV
jgi:pyruvate dehydrogenase E1 component alpha subunit